MDPRCEVKINRGVRQGFTLSPIIFNLYIQESIDMIKENANLRIKINGQKINMLRFANDIALIAESKEDLAQLFKAMDKTFEKELKMRINLKKTNVLVCERENNTRIQIKIRNQTIEKIDKFTYLGSAISKDG
jgi:hypothetical protein